MKVLPKKGRVRQRAPQKQAKAHTFPAPVRGLVFNENLAVVQPGSASILDNWICTTKGIKARGGSAKIATLGSAVTSLFSFKSGSIGKIFGATATDIYDVSAVADPDVTPTADVTGQTAGYYSTQQFGTAGGDFLVCVNGSDDMQQFDGGTWTAINAASSPTITGVSTSALSHVWSYASRLFFVEKDTLSAWYLPVDSIAGAASEFSLAGIFQLGGSLLFGGTWSLDSGSGLDDKCIFVSTEGEVAVYEGTNPGDPNNWSLVGVYQVTPPLGQNCTMRAGGDLLIATQVGLVPISAAISKDVGALSLSSVSKPIESIWTDKANTYTLPWEVVKWPEQSVMLIAMANTIEDSETYCCNLKTGAWSRFTNIGIRTMAHFDGLIYAGGNDGIVKRLGTGGNDIGTPYTAVYVGNFEPIDGVEKTILQARAKFNAGHDIGYFVGARVDYDTATSTPPESIPEFATALWDVAKWDEAQWDGGSVITSVSAIWSAVGRTGSVVAPEVQMTFGINGAPIVELVSVDMTYTGGAFVT